MEDKPKITAFQYEALLERNRELYSKPPMLSEEIAFPSEKQPEYKMRQLAKPKELVSEQPSQ